jgi:acetoacetate decarboxylase
MDEAEVKEHPFAMPLTSPAYPVGSYGFHHREFFTIGGRYSIRYPLLA